MSKWHRLFVKKKVGKGFANIENSMDALIGGLEEYIRKELKWLQTIRL